MSQLSGNTLVAIELFEKVEKTRKKLAELETSLASYARQIPLTEMSEYKSRTEEIAKQYEED